MTAINPARFLVALSAILAARGREPFELDVQRTPGEVVLVRWSDDNGPHDLSLAEHRVIAEGGPDWVADLICAKRARRLEMLA